MQRSLAIALFTIVVMGCDKNDTTSQQQKLALQEAVVKYKPCSKAIEQLTNELYELKKYAKKGLEIKPNNKHIPMTDLVKCSHTEYWYAHPMIPWRENQGKRPDCKAAYALYGLDEHTTRACKLYLEATDKMLFPKERLDLYDD